MGRVPPLLTGRFDFEEAGVHDSNAESATLEKLTADLATVQAAHKQLSADFDTLRKQLEQQPANHTARPASTGGNPDAKLAAY